MERVKDFLYDMSDVLISLLIVAVIFYVVSWKLNESMPMEFTFGDKTTETTTPVDQGSTTPDVTPPNDSTVNRPVEELPSETPVETPVVTPPATPSTIEKITVTIPSGATGFAIAKALKEKGLIADVNNFIKHVEELKLGNKLTAGTFTLSTDMTEEQIIKKIANVK